MHKVDRQYDFELRLAGLRFDQQLSMMAVNYNIMRNVQSQPRAFARWFGRKERLVNP